MRLRTYMLTPFSTLWNTKFCLTIVKNCSVFYVIVQDGQKNGMLLGIPHKEVGKIKQNRAKYYVCGNIANFSDRILAEQAGGDADPAGEGVREGGHRVVAHVLRDDLDG